MTPQINLEYNSTRLYTEFHQMIRNTGLLVEDFNTILELRRLAGTKETAKQYDQEVLARIDIMRPLIASGAVARYPESDKLRMNLPNLLAYCPINTEVLNQAQELKRNNPNYTFTVVVGNMDFTETGRYHVTRIVTVNEGQELKGFISTEGGYLSQENMPVITDPITRELPIRENPVRAKLCGNSGLLEKVASHGY